MMQRKEVRFLPPRILKQIKNIIYKALLLRPDDEPPLSLRYVGIKLPSASDRSGACPRVG